MWEQVIPFAGAGETTSLKPRAHSQRKHKQTCPLLLHFTLRRLLHLATSSLDQTKLSTLAAMAGRVVASRAPQ
jgi:hypothetical protein